MYMSKLEDYGTYYKIVLKYFLCYSIYVVFNT